MIQQISRFDALSVEVHFDNGIPTDDFDVVLFTHDALSIPFTAKQRHGVLYNCRIADGRLYVDISHHELGYGRVLGRVIVHTPAVGDIPATDIVTDFETDFEIANIPATGDVSIGIDVAIRAVAPVPNPTTHTWWVGGQDTRIPYTDGEITTDQITDRAVTTEKIAKGAITNDLLAYESVRAHNIGEGAVTTQALAENAVDSDRLQNDAVNTRHIADGAVTFEKLSEDFRDAFSQGFVGLLDEVNAAKVAANNAAVAADAAKTSADAAQQTVGDMQIGSVNYINRTNQGTTYWTVFNAAEGDWTIEEVQLLGERAMKASGIAGASAQKLLFYRAAPNNTIDSYMYDALREGDDVIISLDADTVNIRYINMLFCRAQGGSHAIKFERERVYISADGLAHYEWRGTVTSLIAEQLAVVYIHIAPTVAADPMSITIANLKLERGTKSTAWTPSQADIDSLGENVVRTTDEQSVTTSMLDNNAVTPTKLSPDARDMFVRTKTAQVLAPAYKEQALANIGLNAVFIDTADLNGVLPDDVAAKVEAAQLLVVSGSAYGAVILNHAYTANGIVDFRAVFDNRTVYYVRYTIATKRITSLATTTITDPNKVSFASSQALTAVQQQQARTNIDAMAATPSGDPMHYMYEEIGATWNAETSYWEIDYLTDISTEQMRLIYLWHNPSTVPTTNGRYGVPSAVRAIVNMNANRAQGIAGYMFSNCTGVELITFRDEGITLSNTASAAIFMFYRCTALQVIVGRIDLHLIKTDTYFNSMFGGCSALREVRLYQLAASGLDLSATSVLSGASVRYLVDNAMNTAPITVYVSPEMHMLLADSEDDWDGILDAATAKQITFEVPVPTVDLLAENENEITE